MCIFFLTVSMILYLFMTLSFFLILSLYYLLSRTFFSSISFLLTNISIFTRKKTSPFKYACSINRYSVILYYFSFCIVFPKFTMMINPPATMARSPYSLYWFFILIEGKFHLFKYGKLLAVCKTDVTPCCCSKKCDTYLIKPIWIDWLDNFNN